jgi:hypothetical protein
MLKLVDIDAVRPSTYNPRKADPRRLDLIELSLRKLGFLLPIYADANGEILSGHQRHHVATRMGLKKVPVFFLPEMDLEKRKAINIAFNRGTNDLRHADTPKNMTEALAVLDIAKMVKKLKDVKDFTPCMTPEKISVAKLVKANEGRWITYSYNMAKAMYSDGIFQPIVVNANTLEVVNGIGRLQFLAERKEKFASVVMITPEQAEFSNTMLNLLSMDFDIHNRYEDLLRYNSFRRARRVRRELGLGFIFKVAPNTPANKFDVGGDAEKKLWKKTHGTYIVDFGAGHLHETNLLRSIGVDVVPFEPYRMGEGEEINKEESVALTRAFFAEIAKGKEFSSVFISSVLNSVPFKADREHIACIAAALCGVKTRLYALATGAAHTNLRQVKGYDSLNEDQSKRLTFLLDYEPNITIADFKEKPKVQKYHTPEEFYALFKQFFGKVQVGHALQSVQAVCAEPLPVDKKRLKAALEFEFDLPYPDGSRMGLVAEAKAAFSERLGIKL